jgi:heterodisulfide reductase subunit A-like polyferredoxin
VKRKPALHQRGPVHRLPGVHRPKCVFKEAEVPDEFNEGLGKRKPVYIPFPQATPQVVLIDPDA